VVPAATRRFDSVADGGKATHSEFCPECGATVRLDFDLMAGIVMLPVGSLHEPGWIRPAMQVFVTARRPGFSLGGEMQSFRGMPG
jgi:hypothetical protein